MTTEQKKWIDEASLFQLLERWRNAPVGDEMFQGDTGAYYSDAMCKKRSEDNGKWVAASKAIG